MICTIKGQFYSLNVWHFLSPLTLLKYLGTLCVHVFFWAFIMVKKNLSLPFVKFEGLLMKFIDYPTWRMKLEVAQWQSAYKVCMKPWIQSPAPKTEKKKKNEDFYFPNIVYINWYYVGKKLLYGGFRCKNLKCYKNNHFCYFRSFDTFLFWWRSHYSCFLKIAY